MALYGKVGSAWRVVQHAYAKVASIWREAKEVYINANGHWTLIHHAYDPPSVSIPRSIERTDFFEVSVDIQAELTGSSGDVSYQWRFTLGGEGFLILGPNNASVQVTSSLIGTRGGTLVCDVTDNVTGLTTTSNPCSLTLRVREPGGNQ